MESSTFSTLALKLGIKSDSTLRKAEELARMVETKWKNTNLSSLNVSSTSIVVMCIELAANHYSQHVDRATAVRLGSLQKKSYETAYKIIEQMLDMKHDASISNLSVQFGCSEAKQLAEQVLSNYQLMQQNTNFTDVNADIFNAASLYISCKKLKIKIDKTKLISCIGARRSVFDRLLSQLENIASTLVNKKKNITTAEEAFPSQDIAGAIEGILTGSKITHTSDDQSDGYYNDEDEPYYIWKERILSEAKAALGQRSL